MLQASSGRRGKQQQEQNSPNLLGAFEPSPVDAKRHERRGETPPPMLLHCDISNLCKDGPNCPQREFTQPILTLEGEYCRYVCGMNAEVQDKKSGCLLSARVWSERRNRPIFPSGLSFVARGEDGGEAGWDRPHLQYVWTSMVLKQKLCLV